MMNNAGIYRIVVKAPGRPVRCYIGQASILRKRRDVHFRSLRLGNHKNQRLQRIFNKYGPEVFSFEVLVVCERRKEIADLYEQAVLDSYPPALTLNMSRLCVGSRLGIKSDPETGRKISASNKGRPRTQSQRDAVSASNKTRIVSAETRAKMSAARMGNKNSLGWKQTDEHKAKVGAFFIGRKKSAEEIQRRLATRAANRAAAGLDCY